MRLRDRVSAAVKAASLAFSVPVSDRGPTTAQVRASETLFPASAMASLGPKLDNQLDRIRAQWGGQLAPPPITVTRWHLGDLEAAQHEADMGDLHRPAQLARWYRRDGILAGVLSTTTGGLVRLPIRFSGDPEMVGAIEGRAPHAHHAHRNLFETMFPSPELALMSADGLSLGVGVAEMVAVKGADYKVMRRLEPEFLRYRWSEDRWYYASLAGMLPITPGDGRWILHLPGGRSAPWNNGLWTALGRSCISKEHAILHRENYCGKLANPARVATAPQGAAEEHKQAWFAKVMAWGVNTTFGLTPGYEVKLLESNGRGYEIFAATIETSNMEIIVALGSSPVLIDGGSGFANADVHKSIRADVIKERADALAYTINGQGIPPWVNDTYGADALESAPQIEWDVTPTKDLKTEAESMTAAATVVVAWNKAFGDNRRVDDIEVARRFGVPIYGDDDGDDGKASPAPEDTIVRMKALTDQVAAEKSAGFEITQDRVAEIARLLGVTAPRLASPASDVSVAPPGTVAEGAA